MQIPEHIWFLMSRNLSGEATEQENGELMQLLQEQPLLQQQFDLLKRWWATQAATDKEPVEPSRIAHILERSSIESAQQPAGFLMGGRLRKMYARAAIIIALLITIGGLVTWLVKNDQPALQLQEVIAQKGSRTRTLLPDGSAVWLNAGSRITYAPGLKGDQREVSLEGEAYFEVIKNASRPFIVHTKEIDIRVLGTAFNVRSYPNDKEIETTLIHGLVSISSKTNKKVGEVYLRPHQKFVLAVNNTQADASFTSAPGASPLLKKNPLHIVNLDSVADEKTRPETAWIYNRLEFRGDSFEDLAKKLERWYNIDIRFADEQVKQLTFNGSLENETVAQAFGALQAAVPFKFTINENEISVRSH